MSVKKKLIIIGSGPAGYTAGIYASRAELKPLLFAGEKWGGQLMNTTVVENWPGADEGIVGPELMDKMRKQAAKFGTEIVDKNVTKVDFSQRPFKVWQGDPLTSSGQEYLAESVIVATGAEAMMLGIPGEDRLLGRGVATCAVCDAAFYREKTAAVVGGGDAAVEDTLALTKFAKKVYVIVRRDELRASKIMAGRVLEHEKVEMVWNSEVVEVVGEDKLEKIKIKNNKTNEMGEMGLDGLFYAIGHKPVTEIFKGQLEIDQKGYLVTSLGFSAKGIELAGDNIGENGLVKYPTQTSVEGVFGAGDVVDFAYQQAVTASAMGCQAALDAERWLESGGGRVESEEERK